MSALTSADYAKLLSCLAEMQAHHDLPTLRVWLLESGLPRLVSADWYSYSEADLRSHTLISLLRPDDAAASRLAPAWAHYAHEHPLVQQAAGRADAAVHKISDFMTQRHFHGLGIYAEVYRQITVEYQIALPLLVGSGFTTAIALSRRRRDFSERDRSILQLLQPQLTGVFQLLTAVQESQNRVEDAMLALDVIQSFAITVTESGQVLQASTQARRSLSAYFGCREGDYLPLPAQAWLREQILQPQDVRSRSAVLERSGLNGTLLLRCAPHRRPGEWVVVLTEEAAPDWEIVLSPLGLSRREIEVVRWLVEGKANGEIAIILGISVRTVHKHLERVFATLSVESRTAAIAKVLVTLKCATRYA